MTFCRKCHNPILLLLRILVSARGPAANIFEAYILGCISFTALDLLTQVLSLAF